MEKNVDPGASPDLALGGLIVEPLLLQVTGPRSRATLEPRVMQVLVELLRATGRPVTRDLLGERCWAGRAVGEDALNRSVAKLRRNLHHIAGEDVVLETIRGVGYRLQLRSAGHRPDDRTQMIAPALDLEMRALSAMFEGTAESLATAVRYLEQATSANPTDAPMWGSLAMAHVLSLAFAGPERAMTAARAREAAHRAQALQANEGRSLAALASLEPTYGDWHRKGGQLRTMLGLAPPGTAPLIFQQILFLAGIGAMKAALDLVETLAAAAPLISWIQSARAHANAANGLPQEALRIAEAALLQWPSDRLTWFTYLHLALHAGRISDAVSLVRDPRRKPGQVTASERMLAERLVTAMATPNTGLAREVIADHAHHIGGEQAMAEQAVLAAAHLGRPEEALGLLQRLYAEPLGGSLRSVAFPKIGLIHPSERSTALLFLAPLHVVRAHPGFADILRQTGLAKLDVEAFSA